MRTITTQKLAHTLYDDYGAAIEIHEIILQDSTTGELRWNRIHIDGRTPDQLWNISEPCDYAKARELEYPSWDEQFDDQYWDKKNGTDTWIKKIDDVKTKYPKP